MFGGWGSHYGNGDLVLTKFPDGEFGLMVVVAHTGDFHHKSVRVRILDEEDVPEGHMRLRADPTDVYYSYWAGPIVLRLDDTQVMSLAGGIDVPGFDKATVSVRTILSMTLEGAKQPYKSA